MAGYSPEVRFLMDPRPRPDFVSPCEGTEHTLKQRGRVESNVAMPAATSPMPHSMTPTVGLL